MSFKPTRRDFLALLAAIPTLPRHLRSPLARRAPALVARPFDLHRVRLLPGIFRDDLEVNRRYMMGLDPDRLLVSFRTVAKLPTTAEPYYGWEAPNNELRGHFVGHYLSGCALLAAQTGDPEVQTRGDLLVDALARCQAPNGYLSAFPEELFDRFKARRGGVWAPFYTIHKIHAGMIDSYTLGGNKQALDVAVKMGGWIREWVKPLDDTAMQQVLRTEFGGIGDSLNELAQVTGDMSWIDVSKRFDHERILTPLAEGRDELTKVHANTTIPKALAAARRYDITGDQRSHDIANYFWHEVTEKRSFCTGGSSSDENWRSPVGQLSTELGSMTEESCVTYNLLKLTRNIFSWTADARAADYYERALFNGMLGTQHPADGEKIYYTPLASGYWRMFGTPDHGFWCCHGSGVESHAKFGDSIYFHDDGGIWVNQFIASEVEWPDKGVRLVQETKFPAESSSRFTVHVKRPTILELRIRSPYWATAGTSLRVVGTRVALKAAAGGYLTINREWKDGDVVEFSAPMGLHVQAMPDDATLQAVMFGPLVLAGKLGPEPTRAGPTPPRMTPDFDVSPVTKPIAAPTIKAPSDDVTSWVKAIAGKPLQFVTVGQESPVALVPFNGLYDERYVVYWKVARG